MESNPQKDYFVEMPIWLTMIIGILVGWALCFILICFMYGQGIDEIIAMIRENGTEFHETLFISFPIGAILGLAFVIIYRKSAKDADNKKPYKEQHNDNVAKLKELKELMDAGVLSQEEFNVQKEKILNSI